MKDSWFQRYVLPGFIFQSAIIGGAYGTGKELDAFFMDHGPLGGLFGMATTMVIFSVVLSASFEFSRKFQLYDYRSFFKKLLGRGWPIYEVLYLMSIIIAISVVGAAAGDIVRDTFGIPAFMGTGGVMIMIALLLFYGTSAVERFLAAWSIVLFSTYIAFLIWNLAQNGSQIAENIGSEPVGDGWARSGLAYSGYNLAVIPALLFCIRHLHSRGDAVKAGLLGGPIAMLPAMLFFVAMIGNYDAIAAEGDSGALPITIILNALDGGEIFSYVFPIVLFGTFIETGAAMIHGVNERLDHTFAEQGRHMQRWMRSVIAITILATAIFLADAIGLTLLISKGYGTITWGYMLVFILPLLTYGLWLMSAKSAEPENPA